MTQPVLPKRITVRWLKEQNACKEEVDLFQYVFPGGALLTKENLETAWRSNLNVNELLFFVRYHSPVLNNELKKQRELLLVEFNSQWTEEYWKRWYALTDEIILRAGEHND